MNSTQAGSCSAEKNEDRFLYLKEIAVDFTRARPNYKLQVKLKDEMKTRYESKVFGEAEPVRWECNIYVKSPSMATMTVQGSDWMPRRNETTKLQIDFGSTDFRESNTAELDDVSHSIRVKLTFGISGKNINVARLLAGKAISALSTKISMLEKMDRVLGYLELVVKLGVAASELNPRAKAAVAGLNVAFRNFQKIPTCHREFVGIMDDIVLILPLLESLHKRVEDEAVRAILKSFIDFIDGISRDLFKYSSGSKLKFVVRNWYKSKQNEVSEFRSRLIQLCLTLNIGISNAIHHRQLSAEEKKALRRLRPPEKSSFDVKRCCLRGTRVDVLRRIDGWTCSTDGYEQLYWIHGVAGCGKSAVAASIASELDSRKVLSGSFFCSRDIPERRSSTRVVHALVYFLARAIPPFKDHLLRLLKDDPDFMEKPISTQARALLSYSYVGASDCTQSEPIIVVIDALDECGENEDAASFIVGIIKLVPSLKIIVTSRPLPQIQDKLKQNERLVTCNLFEVDAFEDILRFTHKEFRCNKGLPRDFSEDQIEALARKASGHFIWITTVLKHVSSQLRKKREVLRGILASTPDGESEEKIDALYRQVLDDVSGRPDNVSKKSHDISKNKKSDDRLNTIRLLIGLVFVTSRNKPLPAEALHALVPSEFELEELTGCLQKLGSVITAETRTGAIRACHPSFLDFVGSQERAADYWMESSVLDMKLAEGSLDIMASGLEFNICHLETSHLLNGEVGDLADRIRGYISYELQYSCLYWLDHLSRSGVDGAREMTIKQKLREVFCQTKSLYWLEVLSLMSELKTATSCLRNFPRLVKWINTDEELRKVITDLYRFVMAFHEPMAMTTPHIYISALLWAPSRSVTAESQSQRFISGELVLEGLELRWPTALRTLSVSSHVTSVTYSQDGRRIVSGSHDSTIRIWDAETGAPIGEPLRGHEDSVSSVGYSPDGHRIVSGSDDKTIRIWDAITGAPIGEPLRGHEDSVNSVGYSPDGHRIVSGSDDSTMRIWDASTGAPIGEPLQGHAHSVLSVGYSPDGRRIVSGSDDSTMHIWDASTGAPIGEPLQGHGDSVSSVGYSPDGRYIVSGSYDKTICMWDASTGAPIGEPLRGHEDCVNSVGYSSDRHCIVSGSYDKTIRIWDASTGAPIGEPLRGHEHSVWSVGYSPDGHCIVSGSEDSTIRIWDAITGVSIGEPLRGHEHLVWSVGYSPDGHRIVSGSYDKTIRIWDAITGVSIGEPLRGHEDSVLSVGYSPDGHCIVSGSDDSTMRIWDASTGAPIGEPLRGHKYSVSSVGYSPDGRCIVSGSSDKTIRVWDASTGAPIGEPLRGHKYSVNSVGYSLDGRRIVSGSGDGTMRIWDASTGAPIGEPLRVHVSSISSVRYSPDRRRIVSRSSDSMIRIWDAITGALIGEPLRGHVSSVSSVGYSPDGRRIVSGSSDKTIRVWDANAHLVARELHKSQGGWLGFSRDGKYALSSSHDDNTLLRIPPSIPTDGWIRTSEGGLLLWIPHEYRNGVCDMSLYTLPRNAPGHPVRIDWSRLPHGTVWTSVKRDD
ncbi:WD40 repeat-like protein [Fomitiporia mediterranea MF3/22]|uniref:WD40 repeat-like protein n=1 Tax=Fomitiporia mediterranea (strain MF3/22) TaxID=694068 RepID=UPI0004409A56|nr:WD40 repeat-like protein [Fomitiporia mediterranea MF3/22]EJD02341.1 WD40 repeat-like protein [Fomitiporia mediterranea MF3/22]